LIYVSSTGNESPFHNKSVTATQLYKEEQDVQRDQSICDQRYSSARAIIIADWEHKIYLLLLWLESLMDDPSLLKADAVYLSFTHLATGAIKSSKGYQDNHGTDKRDQHIRPGQRNTTVKGGWHLGPCGSRYG
jgi:hypothetical protein